MMDKYKRLAIIFSVSYATILIILLIEFFVKFFADADINYLLLIPVVAGTVIFTILNAIIKEKEDGNEIG